MNEKLFWLKFVCQFGFSVNIKDAFDEMRCFQNRWEDGKDVC